MLFSFFVVFLFVVALYRN